MQTSHRWIGLVLLLLFIAFIYLSLVLLSPPKAVPESADVQVFSAQRALKHLEIIAKEPHSSGTPAHEKVKNYLLKYCRSMGLEVSLHDATGLREFPGLVLVGRTQNIIARLKGTQSQKTILVMSHYDSQPNTPGAADDGAGIAAMLESIRALKAGPPLKHDVVFLMTDLEEVGLLGAEAYVNQLLKPKDVGILLNFESRGNSGVSFTFEVSDQNGWLMREFAKAAQYPFANSLAYEIYKLMPNDSDFTMFKDTGISGLNAAFIEGFSYYHSPEDTPENINLGSVQHHGTHMLGLIRHFGQLSLSQTKASDAIFFNLIGTWLVLYPASWDWALILLTTILFGVVMVIGLRKKRIQWADFFWGLWYFIDVIGLALGLTYLLHLTIPALYPHYSNFYASNFYNATDYLYTLLGFGILAFMVIFGRLARKRQPESLSLGAIMLLVVMMYLIKIFLQTGAFIVYIPLLAVFTVYLILFGLGIQHKENPLFYAFSQWLAALPMLGIWVPFVYIFFVVFSWDIPYAAVLMIVLMTPLFINSLSLIPKLWIEGLGLFLVLLGLVLGHLHAAYTPQKPLQSNLFYALDLDNSTAHWVSMQKNRDAWNQQYLQQKEKSTLSEFFGAERKVWKNTAPALPSAGSTLIILQDTMIAQQRKLTLRVMPSSETNTLELRFPPKTKIIKVNERQINEDTTEGNVRLRFYAPPQEGLELICEIPLENQMEITVFDRKMGLPVSLMAHPVPKEFIPAPNYYSHVTLLKKSVSL
ncbi:MAG: M20/M25/M40 family metallo-hydrolase [Microscillaceae bacterium]|nr:M20/M25/M40 family metallo-hydrolase [Microscillaceae bacterium]